MAQTVIKVTPEVPIDLTLAYVEGKPVAHGKMMFSTTDGRALFVSEAAGREIQQRLNDLRIRAGDRVLIQQSLTWGSAGDKQVEWKVYRAQVACGAQRDGTFVVPSQPGAAPSTTAPVAAAVSTIQPPSVTSSKDSPYEHSGESLRMRQQANMISDCMASCLAYAKRHSDLTHDDVVRAVLAVYARAK